MEQRADFSGNPNSKHQLWSRWTFGVQADPSKLPAMQECAENFRRWAKAGFQSSAGRGRVDQPDVLTYVFQVEIEGPPATDPEFREHVKRQFIAHFMFPGFGFSSSLVQFDVKILAGSRDDGTPADQLVVMPPLSDLLKGLHDGERPL
jgi:hypothetical protein